MNKAMSVPVQEAIHKLLHYGFQECTEVASRQNGMEYLCAFKRSGDEQEVCYSCVTEEDLFTLLALVEASASASCTGFGYPPGYESVEVELNRRTSPCLCSFLSSGLPVFHEKKGSSCYNETQM